MTRLRRDPLSIAESAALTRLVIAYCLGRGGLAVISRSLCLQICHPSTEEDYVFYKWRRICQYLPHTSAPRLYDLGRNSLEAGEPIGQWRLRLGSRYFSCAHNLLYPGPDRTRIQITPEPLELVGLEGIAALWGDRGRILHSKRQVLSRGRLNLSRYDWISAGRISQWIKAMTGATSVVAPNPQSPNAPSLLFDHLDLLRLLGTISDTWMAQAACLRHRFAMPEERTLWEADIRTVDHQGRGGPTEALVASPRQRPGGRKRRGTPVVVPPLV